jgi:hypothetical protein
MQGESNTGRSDRKHGKSCLDVILELVAKCLPIVYVCVAINPDARLSLFRQMDNHPVQNVFVMGEK